MTFQEVVIECSRNRELVEGFDRLWGTNLSRKGHSIIGMVDDASGKTADDVSAFVAFVYECVWTRIPRGTT